MTDTTTHLKVVEVENEEQADVTLEGEETQVAELCEVVDLDCLLQNKFLRAEAEISALDVDVTPHNGLRGLEADIDE